tara:strand:- start:249 stop:380 length:132 start_codon:yes stop_codon:yes gene_type:complete
MASQPARRWHYANGNAKWLNKNLAYTPTFMLNEKGSLLVVAKK